MAVPRRVVVDTNAFFALIITGDLFHRKAEDAYERMIDRRQELWTTSYVLSECIALLHRRHDFDAAAAFVERFEESVQVFWVNAVVHNEAWRRFADSRGVGLNLVDWTVAVVAESMNAPISPSIAISGIAGFLSFRARLSANPGNRQTTE